MVKGREREMYFMVHYSLCIERLPLIPHWLIKQGHHRIIIQHETIGVICLTWEFPKRKVFPSYFIYIKTVQNQQV